MNNTKDYKIPKRFMNKTEVAYKVQSKIRETKTRGGSQST